MAFHFLDPDRYFPRLVPGIIAALALSACASNPVKRPCIDVTSIACSQDSSDAASNAEELPVAPKTMEQEDQTDQLVSAATPGQRTNGSLTLAQVAAHTINNNPDIAIIRAQADTAKAGIDVAHVAYAPKVDFSAAIGPERTYNYESEIQTDQTRSEASLRATQLLFDFGKTGADVDWATALHNSTVWRQQAQTDKILLEMIDAYLSVLEVSQQISNAQANLRAHEEMLRIIKLNFDAGNASDADVQRITVGLESARSQLVNLRSQRQNAASNFKRLTGLEPTALRAPAAVPRDAARLNVLDLEKYASTNPKMISFEWDIVSLEAQKRSLQLDYLPEVSLVASARLQQNVAGENPLNANGRVMVTVSGQLFDGGDRQAKIQQLIAREDEVKYRYRKALDQLEQDIRDSERIIRTANQKRASIAERIKASENVVALYQQQFEAGTRTIFELLDAQNQLFSARSEQITSRFEVMRANYQAAMLNGNLVDVVLGN